MFCTWEKNQKKTAIFVACVQFVRVCRRLWMFKCLWDCIWMYVSHAWCKTCCFIYLLWGVYSFVLFIFVFPPFKFLIFLLHCNLLGFCVCVGKAIVCEHLLLEKQQGFICLSLSLSHVAAPTPLKHYFFVNFLINAAFVCLLFFSWNLRDPFSFGVCET